MMRALNDRLLVRPTPPADRSAGGIIIPEAFRDTLHEGTILSAGPKCDAVLQEGARVLHGNWAGTEVTLDGERLLVVQESDVLGIIGE